jgi:hypothetical protein
MGRTSIQMRIVEAKGNLIVERIKLAFAEAEHPRGAAQR